MTSPRQRVDSELQVILHLVAAEAGCHVGDLSERTLQGITRAVLEVYRLGVNDTYERVTLRPPDEEQPITAPYPLNHPTKK